VRVIVTRNPRNDVKPRQWKSYLAHNPPPRRLETPCGPLSHAVGGIMAVRPDLQLVDCNLMTSSPDQQTNLPDLAPASREPLRLPAQGDGGRGYLGVGDAVSGHGCRRIHREPSR
jgi:hypothetical protein